MMFLGILLPVCLRTCLPAPMISRNDVGIWSILKKCIGMVRKINLYVNGMMITQVQFTYLRPSWRNQNVGNVIRLSSATGGTDFHLIRSIIRCVNEFKHD